MPDVREIYEMVSEQKAPEPGALQRQQKRQVRTARNKKIGAFAVAAAIGAAAIALIVVTDRGQDGTTPAHEPSSPDRADAAALEVAQGFNEAYGAFDAQRALSYLSGDAISDWTTEGTRKAFRQNLSFLEASGHQEIVNSCEVEGGSAGSTRVRCTYDFHALRSDEIGLGPYGGSYYEFTVRDGDIVQESGTLEIVRFSPQVWDPFADWVSSAYPEDAAVMYEDETHSLERHTAKAIRLWEQHTKEYVKEVQRGNLG